MNMWTLANESFLARLYVTSTHGGRVFERRINESTSIADASAINSTTDSSRYQLEYSVHYAIALAALCFVGGIENLLILFTIGRSKRLRTSYYGFIANLATAQLIFCLVIGIALGWVRIIFFIDNNSPKTTMLACAAEMMPYHLAQVCALLTRLTIGLDRLLAFSLPIEYRNRSKWYAPATVSVCWLWPLVEVSTYFGVNYYNFRQKEMPMCSGSGWKTGHFLVYTAYRDLAVGGLTVTTYLTTAALVAKKFISIKLRGERIELQSKPYQFRLLIASGVDAMIFTTCNLMAYVVRSFVMMHLNGDQRLAANFSVGLLLSSTNVTDFIVYLAINRDLRFEFFNLFSTKRKPRASSISHNSATAIVHSGNQCDLPSPSMKKSWCPCLATV